MIAIETHQPAEALPNATASAHRRATAGGNSSPRTSAGAPARSSPESRRSATNSSGSRRSLSISLDISRAAAPICRATVSVSFALLGGAVVRSGWFMAISAFVGDGQLVQLRYHCQFNN